MQFYQILSWFKRNLTEIILSQRKTIAYLVYGLIRNRKIGVASIGRGMKTNTSVRHNIKRVARYLSNDKISIDKSLLSMQKIICSKTKILLIILDWTTLPKQGYQILKASVVGEGRAIPFIFKTYKEGTIKQKQTFFEKNLIEKVIKIIGYEKEIIFIMDKGFGQKPELLDYIKKKGCFFIARTKEIYNIKSNLYTGKIKNLKTKPWEILKISDAELLFDYRSRNIKKLICNIIITQKVNIYSRWILCTNIKNKPDELIIKLYYKRMTIEEFFKDSKNVDNGFCFKKLKLSNENRFDKMLLILCYAYLLLILLGCYMEEQNKHRTLMANTVKYRSISYFQLGLFFFYRYKLSIPQLIKKISLIRFDL